MSFKEYLKNNQRIVYNTFASSIKANRLSHAYLIKGNEGAPLLETALFLAKSLICPHADPLACEECLTCIRFDEGNYADFKLLNGQEKNIKVSDIEELQAFFQNTPSEKSKKMIYIIHALENSNKESLNALLKFLEEPQENVYAFITTYNEEKLLPTILSRTQHLKLLPLKKGELIQKVENEGISKDDAEILSNLYGNVETIVSIGSSKTYIEIKNLVFDTLDALQKDTKEALFFLENNALNKLKDKVNARLYLDIISCAFKDILNIQLNLPIIIESQKYLFDSLAKKLKNVDSIYKEIMLTRGKIELNVNIALLLEHIFIYIYEGEK